MAQSTLHKYFLSPRTVRAAPKTTFLHLPANVRREIYLLAGLSTQTIVYLNYILSTEEHCIQEYGPIDPEHWPAESNIRPWSYSLSHFLDGHIPWPQIRLNRHCLCADHGSDVNWRKQFCICAPLPWQLLYVSKAIADEVSSIFYSENHFRMFRNGLGGLSGLNSLPTFALAKLRSLSICLNYFDPDPSHSFRGKDFGPRSWDFQCHATCAASQKQRLFSKAKNNGEVSSIKEWHQLCQLLQTNIRSNQLELFFTCDVADLEIAEQVLRPFSRLPRLRECSIRLGFVHSPISQEPIPLLQDLAKSYATARTQPSTQKPFDFTALPPEIQLQILSYTTLVTPYDLIFGPNTAISTSIKSPFYEPRTFPYRAYPSMPECCLTCSPSPSHFPSPQICACWSKHAAFSTTCTCWTFPLSFFLVSKKMKAIAEEVFYGSNHFWVLPRWCNASRKLEIFNFLTWIPSTARRYLKYVTWEMGWRMKSEWNGYLQKGDETHRQWVETLAFLKAIPAGQLTLAINTNFSQSEIYYANGGWEYGDSGVVVPDKVYIEEDEHTFSISHALAQDLVTHDIRLKDLFWHFKGPRLKRDIEDGEDGMGDSERGRRRRRDKGGALEKIVMGSSYEGEERGKYERRAEWNGYRDRQPPY